ncbi:DNA-binding transcriptional activator of the SARP family [Micromonospora viridifaciens]|uniref:DNA-binding transcriptional activator of the SARP family n=2 Tax=Micromonospora viridifaciens TaxID=1881 RepID=A0A1C4XBF4_MICVI|nr:DNA-binding transcriptional activator of the SARP family [Micromonospora viridifaciens]
MLGLLGPVEAAVRDGRYDDALRHLAAVPADVPLPAALAWRLGVLLHQQGRFDAAEACYRRAVLDVAEQHQASALAEQAQVLAGWAATRWARGDQAQARQFAEEAVHVADRSGDDSAVAAAYVAQALIAFSDGDRADNEHAYARALAAAERAGDFGQQLRIRCNIGSRLVEEGRYRPAVEELGEAVRLGELVGHQTLLALALHNRAEAWLGLGELRRARGDADEALTRWQRAGSPLAAFGLTLTARVHRVRGAARQAVAAYQAALAMAEPDGNAQVLVEACAGLARISYADNPVAAAQYAERALTMPSAAGPTVAELAAGWVALCSGDPQRALRHGEQVRAEAGRRRDAAGLAEAMELAALAVHQATPEATATRGMRRVLASLVEAAAIWAELGNEFALATNALLQARLAGDRVGEEIAYERLHQIGVQEGAWQIAGPLAAIGPTPVPEIEVQTLGHFSVRLAGVPVPAGSWQSRKARDLLKMLAGQLGKPVAREALATALWPQARTDVALRRLSVLISTVRGVLDPARQHPADRYLATDPATVRLDPEHVAVDAVRFHQAARAAVAADGASATLPNGGPRRGSGTASEDDPLPDGEVRLLSRLEAVVAMYAGDFCDDGEIAGDWVKRPRAVLADLHREVMHRLARRWLRLGRSEAAIGWYLRLTAEDCYDEPAHLGLIRALSAAGRHGEAGRRYQEYVARMGEIDIEPAAFPPPERRPA